MILLYKILAVLAVLDIYTSASRVLELSDKFSEIRKDGGYWLVKFYAPWCGHCKRLEPVWNHVAQALYKTNIRVGRVDCTRFPSIATEFSVSGYPTIKFITPEEDHTFHGDRTKEDVINFAIRMAGPPVQQVTKPESFFNLKNMNQVFFMYVGNQNGPVWDAYYDVATKFQPNAFFYFANSELGRQHMGIDELPAIFVYKENTEYYFPGNNLESEALNSSIYEWVNEERFEPFPKITRGNINELMQTKKNIVLVVLEETKLQTIPAEMLEFKEMVESLVTKKRDKYHKYFQFGWVANPELANSIAMQVLSLPHLLVLNSTTNHHYIPEDDPTQLTSGALDVFLERICNQSAPVYGGNTIAVRLYRTYFEASTSLGQMWQGNPVLTTVLFGLPLGFLSLILYSICCYDILDADYEEEELLHEKRE